MKKLKSIKILLIIAICLIISNLSTVNAQKRKTKGTKQNVNPSQNEGQREANKFWSKYIALCGSSRYVKKAPGIFVELKGLNIQIDYEMITEADKLNRVQAKGSSRFSASSYRTYSNSTWKKWGNGIPEDLKLSNVVRFQKINGIWSFTGTGYFNDYAKPVICSDLPWMRSKTQMETPTNSVQISDDHIFPIEEFVFLDSTTKQTGTRFPKSTTTFINWRIIYTGTAFDYKLPPVESYWYKDGVQWANADSANFSNVGKGQLWNGKGWAEPGRWEIGVYTVKVYLRKQLIAQKNFEIVSDEALPSTLRYDGLYYYKFDAERYWFFRFFEDGTVRDLFGFQKNFYGSNETSLQSTLESAWDCTNDDILYGYNFEGRCKNFSMGQGSFSVESSQIEFVTSGKFSRSYNINFKGKIANTSLNLSWDSEEANGTDTIFTFTRCPYRDCYNLK